MINNPSLEQRVIDLEKRTDNLEERVGKKPAVTKTKPLPWWIRMYPDPYASLKEN